MEEPTRHLTEPKADKSVSKGYVNPTSLFDLVSLTHWANKLIEDLTGFNVIDECINPLVGDWEKFAKYGDALSNLGEFMEDLGANIQESIVRLDISWDGNASDAAYKYFTRLAVAASDMRKTLKDASKEYEETARAVWLTADSVSGLVKQMIDAAIIAAVAAAAGTIAAETVVGAIAGYAIAAAEIVRIIALISKASKLIVGAGTAITASAGSLIGIVGQGTDISKLPLPGSAYNHPAV